jgi:hypothetical protein
MKALRNLKASHDFVAVKAATIAVCTLIVGYGVFLFFANSPFLHGTGTAATGRQAIQVKLTVVTADGAVCSRTLFDNRSSRIVSVERGACDEAAASGSAAAHDDDGPLGSIRKALNRH